MRVTLACLAVVLAVTVTIPALSHQQAPAFGGTYATLLERQQQLFADAVVRFNRVTGRDFAAASTYDGLPSSHRTTFEAVTHALLTTPLTDPSGDPFATAADVVEWIDEIAGERRGARGDAQFRLYAYLRPDAVAMLDRSREFRRGADNTVYHPGFPISYRQQGGVPSVQISIARDGRAADIDVDYRSSRFPAALVNGHLTKSNSDVRAGGNATRHNRRWAGLTPWWESLLAFFRVPAVDPASPSQLQVPERPRRRARSAAQATADFLDVWLVQQRANEAAAYFGPRSFGCVRGAPAADTGFVRYRIAASLDNAVRALGRITGLAGVVSAPAPWDQRLTKVSHDREQQFLLARVPAAAGPDYDCDVEAGSGLSAGRYDDQFAAAVNLQLPGQPAYTLLLIWAREAKEWRIVNIEAIEGAGVLSARTARLAPTAARNPRVAGDPGMTAAAQRYYETWLLDRDVERALAFYAPDSWRSSAAALADEGQTLNQAQTTTALRRALRETINLLGRRRLPQMIRGVPPVNPDMAIVTHTREDIFTVVASSEAGSYISYVQLLVPGEPAYLWSRWEKRDGRWLIASWEVVSS
jgi:hypothetical protein